MTFRTALCDLLGIEYPIVQSGMGAIAGPELVAEVCRAGGLGILAGLNVPPDDLRAMIRRVRGLTDRPFGVNLWLHPALRPPIDPAAITDEALRGAQGQLNRFRQYLGIPTTTARPGRAPDLMDATIKVVLDERPAVFSAALGWLEPALAQECRRRGIKIVAMVSTVQDARTAAAAGADVIVATAARRADIARSTASLHRPRRPASARWRSAHKWSTPCGCPSSRRAGSPTAAGSSRRSLSAPAASCSARGSWPRASRWRPSSTRSACWRATAGARP